MTQTSVIPAERIASRIYVIRGEKVMLDSDLAALYGETTKRLNEQVRRNPGRFPGDFAFQLTDSEWESLRSQIATLKPGRGQHRKYPPFVFSEQGVAMLSGVLHSAQAVQVNVAIMRTFVRLRRLLASNEDLARRVEQHDREIGLLFEHVGRLLAPPELPPKHPIGFAPADDGD